MLPAQNSTKKHTIPLSLFVYSAAHPVFPLCETACDMHLVVCKREERERERKRESVNEALKSHGLIFSLLVYSVFGSM